MILHRLSDDVSHFVVATIIHFLHRVQNAALHGFQAVFNGRYCSFKNNVRGIIKEPVLVLSLHARIAIDYVVIFTLRHCLIVLSSDLLFGSWILWFFLPGFFSLGLESSLCL